MFVPSGDIDLLDEVSLHTNDENHIGKKHALKKYDQFALNTSCRIEYYSLPHYILLFLYRNTFNQKFKPRRKKFSGGRFQNWFRRIFSKSYTTIVSSNQTKCSRSWNDGVGSTKTCKKLIIFILGAQSFTYFFDLGQDINGGFAFSRCLNGTYFRLGSAPLRLW